MPRPRKCRKVCCLPRANAFVPIGGGTEGAVVMTVDEYEAIRLIDHEGFSQEACSAYMHVARTTVQQIYNNARKKLSMVLVDGLPLKIEGGDYRLCDGAEQKCGCGGCQRHRQQRAVEDREGGRTMIVAIPVDENKKDVCVSFGRAPYFLLHDSQSGEEQFVENPGAQAEGGAGICAAQFVVDSGAGALLTIRCGENAAEVLHEAQVKIYEAAGNASQSLAAFAEGTLAELTHFHAGFHGIR